MKIKHILLLGAALCSPNGFINPIFAQTTAFTYQGRLSDGGAPANGNYDLCFALYDAVTNGNVVGFPQTNSAVAVSNGLFAVTLDFGPIFTGTNYWLDISVCPTGETNFTELSPRQPILPTPYAIFANSASNLLGNLPAGVVTNGASGVNISGTFNGDGDGMTNLNGMNLQPGTVPGSAIGSIDASQVNGLGTAATNDAANFVASTNGFAADLTIQSSSGNNLTIWATNSSSALYINGDYRNGINGDRYRAIFASGDPGLIDNGWITLDGNSNIYCLTELGCFDVGADTPYNTILEAYWLTNGILDCFTASPYDNSYTNAEYPGGYETSRIKADGRIDSWNLWGWHDLNPRIVLQENDYTGNSTFAIDTREGQLILGATTFSNVVSYAPSETGQEQNYGTNVTPGIIISANGYVGIAQINPLAVPQQALDVNGNVVASGTFMGNGSGLTNLNGMNLQPGTVSGSAIDSLNASQINGLGTAATLDTNQIDLAGAGTAAAEAIGASVAADMTNTANVFAGTFIGDGSGLTNLNSSDAIAATNGFASFATNVAAIDATGWTNDFGVDTMVYVNGTAGQEVMIYDGSTNVLFTDTLGNGTLSLELHPGWFFSGDNLNGTAVAE